MRIVNPRQPNQPPLKESLPRHDSCLSCGDVGNDVAYLIKCLSIERNTSYKIVDRPDTKNRQSPQPDYLVRDCKTGDLMTIEHVKLVESQNKEERKANLVNKSPDELRQWWVKDELRQWWVNVSTPRELGKRLPDLISKKLSKGQFKDFSHTERILLARDAWGGITVHILVQAEPYFALPENVDCDHFYLILIADPVLVEVF